MTLELKRGINIEGWLEFLKQSGRKRRPTFTQADVERLAGLGFDHIRINVDEEHLWDDDDRPIDQTWQQVDSVLDWCAQFGMKAIFDLHVLRCHFFNAPERPLFDKDKPEHLERFCECWRRLSAHLIGRPRDFLAYEILNEPVADDPEDWNRILARAIEVLRDLEPERIIILGSNNWSMPEDFEFLSVPDDRKVILTFHLYKPFMLTHYGIKDKTYSFYEGLVHYPGVPATEADLAGATAEQIKGIEEYNVNHDRAVLTDMLKWPLAVQRRTGLPLYCGEWGCMQTASHADRLRWCADIASVLAEHNIGWAIYSYAKGGFGIRDKSGEIDEELLERLNLKKEKKL